MDELNTEDRIFESAAELFGVLPKQHERAQICYRLLSERVAMLWRAVCTRVAMELDSGAEIEPSDRMVSLAHR